MDYGPTRVVIDGELADIKLSPHSATGSCGTRRAASAAMPAVPDASDSQSLQLKLRLAAEPDTGGFAVTIEFFEIDVSVEVLDIDLRRAIRTAAGRCAQRLCDHGYAVTPADVIRAFEDALESSEFGIRPPPALN